MAYQARIDSVHFCREPYIVCYLVGEKCFMRVFCFVYEVFTCPKSIPCPNLLVWIFLYLHCVFSFNKCFSVGTQVSVKKITLQIES